MAPDPTHHPLHDRLADPSVAAARRRAIAAHPAGRGRIPQPPADTAVPLARPASATAAARTTTPTVTTHDDEAGSMTTEYGLIVVVGATIASLVIRWATGGAVFELLDRIMAAAGRLLGLS